MRNCSICLKKTGSKEEYHSRCLQTLFGTGHPPQFPYDLGQLYKVGGQMAGKMSISGVQEKVSLKLSPDLSKPQRIAEKGGRFVLKPEPRIYPSLPLNEHLTMLLASLVEIQTPPFGLIRLKDDTRAFIIKRFDRLEDGTKLRMEDFCQLTENAPKRQVRGFLSESFANV